MFRMFFLKNSIVAYRYDTNADAGGLLRFRYEGVYHFLASVHSDTRRETQFLKVYANHTMLTPPQRAAHLVMFKISIHLCRLRSEKLNLTPPAENSTLASMIQSQLPSFQNPNSQNHRFQAWRYPHSSPNSYLGVYYDKWWLSYPSVKLHQMTMHLD